MSETARGPEGREPTHVRAARWPGTWYDVAFWLALLVAGTVRFVILQRGGAPATIDAGNWLGFADGLLGEGVRSPSIIYPPLVPLLTKASVVALGLTNGVALLGALSSLVPAAGVYVTLRVAGLTWGSLAPALLVAGASSVGEATAWGGFPQLIALGIVPFALILLDRFLRTWAVRRALAAGLALMVIPATSHMLAAVVAVAAAGLVTAALVRPQPPSLTRGQRAGRLTLVLLPSAWLTPLYWTLAQAFGGGSHQAAPPNRLTWSNLFERIEFLYRDAPWLWRFLLPLALLAPVVLWRRERSPLWRVTSAWLAATIVLVAATREERFLYLLTPIAALGLALWTARAAEWVRTAARARTGLPRLPRVAAVAGTALLAAAVPFQLVRGAEFFGQQRDHYGLLTPGLVQGIEYLGRSTSPDSVVAVPSLNNAPLGWWVEGIARRPTLYGSPLHWLVFNDEIRRASIANSIFAPPFPTADKLRAAVQAGIEFILLPTGWTFYDDGAVAALAHTAPGAVLRLNPDVVVIRPEAADT